MSNTIKGRTPPDPNLCLGPDHLKLLVFVDPNCIDQGYNVVGWTVISVNVADLTDASRRTLRTLIDNTRRSFRSRLGEDIVNEAGVIDLRTSAHSVRLPVPTTGAVEDMLVGLAHVYRLEKEILQTDKALRRLLTDAVVGTLREMPSGAGCFRVGSRALVFAGDGLVDRIVAGLPDPMGAIIDDLNLSEAALRRHLRMPDWKPVTPAEWAREKLSDAPIGCFGFEDWSTDRRNAYDALRDHHLRAEDAKAYASSPKGMIEEVLARLGTPSQVERWREGFLPAAETDALLATHLFDRAIKATGPEVRLDRDSVSEALRRSVPAASVTKLAFATEEADGLDDEEWAAFKALRSALPEGAGAHVVRTVANVQTASHGPFAVRRALATLKGSFAGRDVRVRVDLGTGMRVEAA